jgi:hypothetical protein
MPEASVSEQQDDRTDAVNFETNAEDSVPFFINPAYISLGLPRTAFKPEVGGDAE